MTMLKLALAFSALSHALPHALAQPASAQRADTLRMTREWIAVDGEHPMADSLGMPSGLTVDRLGNVYVSDIQNARLWVLDARGRYLRSIGRNGDGPGEFRTPAGAAVGPDGALLVRDSHRISRFTADKTTGLLSVFERRFNVDPMSDWGSRLPTRFMTDGRYFYPRFNFMRDTGTVGWYRSYTAQGVKADSIMVPRLASSPSMTAHTPFRKGTTSGRLFMGVNYVPLAPQPQWDVSARGTLLMSGGDTDVIRELDGRGRVLREFRAPFARTRIPAPERAESTQALRRRLDSIRTTGLTAAGIPDAVSKLQLPDVYPMVKSVVAGADGSIWIQRYTSQDRTRAVFDVYDANGRPVRTVMVPGDVASLPAPVVSLVRIVAFTIDPETGAYALASYRAGK